MAFKINVSDKGKTLKIELESEALLRNKIGEKIDGKIVSPDLEGYELEITGTSDIAGFPGIKDIAGGQLKRVLLRKEDKGMNTRRPDGLRLRKTIRGEEISEKTVQINMKVIKQGSKKFEDLLPKKEAVEGEKPAEEKKEETKVEEAKTEEKKEEPKEETKAEEKKEDIKQ